MGRGFTSQDDKRRQVALLFRRQNGLCHWCKRLMVIFDKALHGIRHTPLPDDLATIDHLDDRFSPERGKRPGEYRRVLACNACNRKRGQESQAARPIEELRARAARKQTELKHD